MNFSTLCKKQLYVIIASAFFSIAEGAQDDQSTDSITEEHAIFLIFSPDSLEKLMIDTENLDSRGIEIPKNTEESITILPTEPKQEEEKPIEKKTIDLSRILFPDEIYSYLTQYTIGQDEAMKSLATFIHEHLITVHLREAALKNPEDIDLKNLKLEKPNILMMGPTGTGKTSTLMLISELLQVPFALGNATDWTAQGYIGGKCQDVFEKLVSNSQSLLRSQKKSAAKGAVLKSAAHGIVFIDEIDKICNKSAGELEVIDRVQQELLPIIQGTDLKLNNGDTLDTSNILFIAGGAFPGLIPSDDKETIGNSHGIKVKKEHELITPRMLESYGMLPELAGRLCNIVQFSHLSKENLKKIVLSSKNSFLQQYIKKYKIVYQIDLTFSDDAIDYIVEAATIQKTGARAINSMIYEIMKDKTFKIKDHIGKPLHMDLNSAQKALSAYANEPNRKDDTSHLMMYT